MRTSIVLNELTVSTADEIAEALGKEYGKKPSRSHVIRAAVAAMRKRMIESGELKARAKSAV